MKRILFVLTAAALAVSAAWAADSGLLKFRIGAFSGRDGMPSYKHLGLERTDPVKSDEPAYYLVQFSGPVSQFERAALAKAGAKVFDYIPNNAHIVKMTPGAKSAVEKLPGVVLTGYYQPAFRIHPDLLSPPAKYPEDKAGRILLNVAVFERDDAKRVEERLAALAGVAIERTGGGIVKISAPEDLAVQTAKQAAGFPEVYWVERYYQPVLHNAWSRWINQSRDTTGMGSSNTTWQSKLRIQTADDSLKMPMYRRGLYGQGQIVGDDDTGLDWDNVYFRDPGGLKPIYDKNKDTIFDGTNAHRKIVGYNVHADTFDLTTSGHGTHTSGSIAADSLGWTAASGILPRAQGMAPSAKLAFTDIGTTGDGLVLPNDYSDIYIWAYNAGARITSSSWGQSPPGFSSYTLNTQQLDRCAWDHKDLIMFRSAGNANTGTIDSCNSPATAKNIVCVGANESGFGSGSTTWSATGTTTSNEILDVASFSSHGPTKEGLRRPHILASGGHYIWSVDSDGSLSSNNSGIITMGGTSMSTPTAAGLCALARQYLNEGWYPTGVKTPADAMAAPSGALMKAMMVSSTRNSPGAYSTNTLNSTGTANVPSQGQGWGAMVLDDVLYFSGDVRRTKLFDETYGFTAAGQTHSYTITTGPSATQDFKVVLVYYDYPSAMPVTDISVNDLDLTVSDGTSTYRGSVFGAGGYSATGGSADAVNPEEVVWLAGSSANSRTWTITVAASAVNVGPQSYALVITGDLSNSVPARPSQQKLYDFGRIPVKQPTWSFSAKDAENNPVDFRILYDTLASFATADSQTTSATVASGATATHVSSAALRNQRTYYWRVKARDPAGTNRFGAYSDVRSFTIDTLMTANTCSWLAKKTNQHSLLDLSRLTAAGDSVVVNTSSVDSIFFRNFEADNGGFSMVSNNGNALDDWTWTTTVIPYGSGNPKDTRWWMCNADAVVGINNEYLLSPTFSAAAASGCSLTWYGAHRFYNANDSFNVDISTNGGGNWTKLLGWTGVANSMSPSQQYPTFRVAAFDGQANCRLRWRFYDNNGYGAGVDNVLVFAWGQNNQTGQLRTATVYYPDLNSTYARANWGYIHCHKRSAADSIGLQVEFCNNGVWALVPDGALAGNSAGYYDNSKSVITRNITGLNTVTYDSIRVLAKLIKGAGKAAVNPALKALEVGATSATPQAVELSFFAFSLAPGGVRLDWRTESEKDCDHWEIERSASPNGDYTKIGQIEGHLNTNEPHQYSYTDASDLQTGIYYYRLAEVDIHNNRSYFGPVLVEIGINESAPMAYQLDKAYPNPMTSSVAIRYALKSAGRTSLRIYNVLGQEVKTLFDGNQAAGYYTASWNGRDNSGHNVSSGVYFYKLTSGEFSGIKKMMVLK